MERSWVLQENVLLFCSPNGTVVVFCIVHVLDILWFHGYFSFGVLFGRFLPENEDNSVTSNGSENCRDDVTNSLSE